MGKYLDIQMELSSEGVKVIHLEPNLGMWTAPCLEHYLVIRSVTHLVIKMVNHYEAEKEIS